MTARYIPVGWYQLKHNKLRLLAAVAGIMFAVVLMMVQQGFREAMFQSSLRWHNALDYDLVILSPKTDYLLEVHDIPRNRVLQAVGFDGVSAVTPVYVAQARWKNPVDPRTVQKIFVVGFNPVNSGFQNIISPQQHSQLRLPDHLLFDSKSRPEFGPVPSILAEHGDLVTEINGRAVHVKGLFDVGNSFGINGALLTSDLNFLRLFGQRSASHVSMGLIQLGEGANLAAVQERLREGLPKDVKILSAAEFKKMEADYWAFSTPIGYVFTFGVIMGFVVGIIIVYQILYSDVQDHLKEYATLKAMGYTNAYLGQVVMQEAVILAFLGFVPGTILTMQLFRQAGAATNLPLIMTLELAVSVLGLTMLMCIGSGLIAIRKLKSAQPAEVF
ncbi:MAG: ABC transporter permease DevC [Pseudomonadales bacterium]